MHLPDMMSSLWLMEPTALEAFATRLASTAVLPPRSAAADADSGPQRCYSVSDGVATVPVSGILLRSVPWYYDAFGIDATSYLDVARGLAQAEADDDVHAIVLAIDSPGGSAAGIHHMADMIAMVGKPLAAHIDTLGASAAYWMASQAPRITANRGAQVGSIGAYTVRVDSSRAAENDGLKVHVISSGKFKGNAIPGTAITDDQLAEVQRNIDTLAAEFVTDVARGRSMQRSTIAGLATGRIWSAFDALDMGLIDDVHGRPGVESSPIDDSGGDEIANTNAAKAAEPTRLAKWLAAHRQH